MNRIFVPLAVLCALAGAGLGFTEPASAATWCGSPGTTDRLPQVVAGYSVHFVYVIPSDGADQLATWANNMQTDAETMDAWWRREDPTRTPRLDTYPFPCGPQLDITLVRLPTSGADTEPIDGRADKVLAALPADLAGSPYQKIVVYYDGPDNQVSPKICGQGGVSFAVVYVNSCADVPNDGIVAHELLHALQAVPPSAPHNCPLPDRGHICDRADDIMYPTAEVNQNLFALLLDPGRDDYYGHNGTWTDVQDSFWLTHLDAQAQLALSFSGRGSVESDIPGIQCSAACTSQWDTGTQVTLSATPANGQRFVRWSGGCTGTGACVVKAGQAAAVNAIFGPATYALKVSIGGKGRVRSVPTALNCPKRCAGKVTSGVSAVLSARPSRGWRFSRWFGACHGTSATCIVPMKSDRVARAVFVRAKA